MFFDNLKDVEKIATSTNCAIFVVPRFQKLEMKNALFLEPEGKASITIEQVHLMMDNLKTRQNQDLFVIIRPAEALTEAAANAILKNLEEPQEKVHFVLVTDVPFSLLPTIRSRAETYVFKGSVGKITEIDADEKLKTMAKKVLAAKPGELFDIAEEICKKKDGVREWALNILSVTVEMAYKTYLLTGKKVFLLKVPKIVAAYEAISSGGHIKLHLVADLV